MSDYPQMPPMTNEERAEFLTPTLCSPFSGTLNEYGTIQTVPIFYKYQDWRGADGHAGCHAQDTQPQAQPPGHRDDRRRQSAVQGRCGLWHKATLEYDDVMSKRTAIFENYMPPDQAAGFAQGLAAKWEPVIIRVKPDRIVSFDYSKGSLI